MAGNWASALGAALQTGAQTYHSVSNQQRQLALEEQRAEEAKAMNLLNMAIRKREIETQPKRDAAEDADAIYKRSPEGAYDNPDFIKLSAAAGRAVPTEPLPTFLDSKKLDQTATGTFQDDSKAQEAGRQGISSVTGAKLPQELLDQRAMRKATLDQAGWELEKVNDAYSGGQSLVRVNKGTGEVKNLGNGKQQAQGPDPQAGLSGDELLAQLDPKIANVVKQLADYKGVLPSAAALRAPYWQNILQLTSQYDPGFDATQYAVRAGLKKDFTSGKSAANIRSLNTVMKHLVSLENAGKKLGNTSMPLLNKGANAISGAFGGAAPNNFNMAATAVQNELATVFKNTGATDQEIKQWRDSINSAQSPEQITGALRTAVELASGRMDAIKQQWEVGMGKPMNMEMLSKDNQGTFDRMSGKQTAPQPGVPQDQPQAEPGGKTASKAEIMEFARAKGVPPAQVANELKAQGYTFVDQ